MITPMDRMGMAWRGSVIAWCAAALCGTVVVAQETVPVTETSGKTTYTYSVKKGTKQREGDYREMRDGKVVQTGQYRAGKKEGLWTSYDANGDKVFDTPFVADKIHGVKMQYGPRFKGMSTEIVEHNCVVATTTFVHGIEHGPHREQAADGTLHAEFSYLFGMRHGPARFFYIQGQKSSEGRFAFDKKVGRWQEWDSNGKSKPGMDYGDGEEGGAGEIAPSVLAALEFSASAFAGWAYGSDAKAQQVDCTQWVFAVLEARMGKAWSKDTRNAIYQRILMTDIGALKPAERVPLIAADDARTKGVVTALVDAGLGSAVSVEGLASGDFVQYWPADGDSWSVRGHSAQVVSARKTKRGIEARLLGSHGSRGGIGLIDLVLAPAAGAKPKFKVWAVRPSG